MEQIDDLAGLRAREAYHIEALAPEYNLARIRCDEPRKLTAMYIDSDLADALGRVAYNRTAFLEEIMLSDAAIRERASSGLEQQRRRPVRAHRNPQRSVTTQLPANVAAAFDEVVSAERCTRGRYLERLLRRHPSIRAQLRIVNLNEEVMLELPADLLDHLDAATANRTAFIEAAVRAALERQPDSE